MDAAVNQLRTESHAIFTKCQATLLARRAAKQERRFTNAELLTISRQYRSVLRAACVNLQTCSANGRTAFFDSCEMVWAMCEALFIDFDDNLFVTLGAWARDHCCTQSTRWLATIIADVERGTITCAEKHERYWHVVCSFKLVSHSTSQIYAHLLAGDVPSATRLLALHTHARTTDAYRRALKLLNAAPLRHLADNGACVQRAVCTRMCADIDSWLDWQQQCRDACAEHVFNGEHELHIAMQIVCGNEHVLGQLRAADVFTHWYELLFAALLYIHVDMRNARRLVETCQRLAPLKSRSTVDCTLEALLNGDLVTALNEYHTLRIGNTVDDWLTAHLIDLLAHSDLHAGQLNEIVDQPERGSSRQHLLVCYARQLAGNECTFALCVEYFVAAGDVGRHAFAECVDAQMAADSNRFDDQTVMQMLAVFDRHQMPTQSRALCVKLARKHESDGRLLPALAWAVQGNNDALTCRLVEACLLKYAGDDEIMKVDFLDAIDERKLLLSNNSKATFSLITLKKYRELMLSVKCGDHMSSLVALDWLLTPAHRVPRQLLGTLVQHLMNTAGELYAALADRSSAAMTREQLITHRASLDRLLVAIQHHQQDVCMSHACGNAAAHNSVMQQSLRDAAVALIDLPLY